MTENILTDYVTETELAKQLGLHPRSLARWRRLRSGPAWVRVGIRIMYRREAVTRWIEAQETDPAKDVA